jgi:hypothetical protein
VQKPMQLTLYLTQSCSVKKLHSHNNEFLQGAR